ncbi:hypothetical protein DV738_g4748, partial [Chaetothyriales sp. CBS 135597]
MKPTFEEFAAVHLTRDSECRGPHSTVEEKTRLRFVEQFDGNADGGALVLDKDNTLCPPETTKLHPDYIAKIEKLKASPEFSSNRHSILIVSNTAGSTSSAAHEEEAVLLEKELGLDVLRQHPQRRKPFCGPDVLAHFKRHGVTDNPAEIAVVGDRLATDVLLARDMGSWSIWCRDGWRDPQAPARDYRGFFSRLEGRFESVMRTRPD